MSAILQVALVAAAVTFCACYSTWRLLSARLRLRVLDALGTLPGLAATAWFTALRARTVARFSAGCGSCAPAPTRAPGRKQTPGALRR